MKKEEAAKKNMSKPKRYSVSRKGFKKQANDIEWLTQYNRGKEDVAIASLLNYGADKIKVVED